MTDDTDDNIMERLRTQLTERCIEKVSRYAKKRCQLLARYGVRVDDLVQHLVCDAITDTALNIRGWNRTTPLTSHLRYVIHSRTSDLLTHARKFPASEVNDAIADPTTDIAVALMRADTTRKFLSALTQVANDNNDPLVAQLIDVYADGITQRARVAMALGISIQKYDATRKRLARLLTHVPDELRGQARQIVG